MAQRYVDSHCHLDDPRFDIDRREVIARARAAGVGYLLAIGGASGPDTLDSGLRVARAAESSHGGSDTAGPPGDAGSGAEDRTWIYAAGGIHPHEAGKAEERHYEELGRLARDPRFVAIGEIGLDYHYDHSSRDVQRIVLVRQLEIANELRLPVIIHCRDAWADLREIIRTFRKSPPDSYGNAVCGVLHCFSGTSEDALELIRYGFMVSFAGNITFKKAEALRAVARQVPLDRLLSETDSPYLAPGPYRGKRNEPAYVREVIRRLAALHDISEEEMGRHTVENFKRLLRLNVTGQDATINAL